VYHKHWDHVDEKGKVTQVEFTDEQVVADQQLLRHFQGLENVVAEGKDPNHVDHSEAREAILSLGTDLPPLRREHWTKELKRIGVKALISAPKPTASAKDEKKTDTK